MLVSVEGAGMAQAFLVPTLIIGGSIIVASLTVAVAHYRMRARSSRPVEPEYRRAVEPTVEKLLTDGTFGAQDPDLSRPEFGRLLVDIAREASEAGHERRRQTLASLYRALGFSERDRVDARCVWPGLRVHAIERLGLFLDTDARALLLELSRGVGRDAAAAKSALDGYERRRQVRESEIRRRELANSRVSAAAAVQRISQTIPKVPDSAGASTPKPAPVTSDTAVRGPSRNASDSKIFKASIPPATLGTPSIVAKRTEALATSTQPLPPDSATVRKRDLSTQPLSPDSGTFRRRDLATPPAMPRVPAGVSAPTAVSPARAPSGSQVSKPMFGPAHPSAPDGARRPSTTTAPIDDIKR